MAYHETLIARESQGRSAARERGGVGLGVGSSLHNAGYVKATPAGSGRVEPEDGSGQGLRRIITVIIGRRRRKERDRTGQGWPGLARALPSGADSPVFFLRSEAE
jgi:hypothetical protein